MTLSYDMSFAALEAILLFTRCRPNIDSIYTEVARQTGLGCRETISMLAIADGAATQKAVRVSTGLDKVSVARSCRKLSDLGLLVRTPNIEDARSHIIRLSGSGAHVAEDVRARLASISSCALAKLSATEMSALSSALSKFAGTDSGTGGNVVGRPDHMCAHMTNLAHQSRCP